MTDLEVMKAMLVECRAHPESGTRNWKVAAIIDDYLEQLDEIEQLEKEEVVNAHEEEFYRQRVEDA